MARLNTVLLGLDRESKTKKTKHTISHSVMLFDHIYPVASVLKYRFILVCSYLDDTVCITFVFMCIRADPVLGCSAAERW